MKTFNSIMSKVCWFVSLIGLFCTFWGLFTLERGMVLQSWTVATFGFVVGCLFHTFTLKRD